jgi:hypothetical protein
VKSDCGEWQEMSDTYKACQTFLPLSTTVLFGHFAAAKCPHRTYPNYDAVGKYRNTMRVLAAEKCIRKP